MPSASHNYPSQQVGLPENVTDPLLWRLGFDVARAHELDASGRCGNLGCPDEPGPCPARRQAERAMRLAQQDTVRESSPADDSSSDEVRMPQRVPGSGLRAA
ncbi:hypothetical protein AB0H63_21770 [Micromonospora echinospora]|uniref:hypothetical protein n=1 Tax=Micromonospora echinospora TaxID=1877 RepID=UPI0033DE7791